MSDVIIISFSSTLTTQVGVVVVVWIRPVIPIIILLELEEEEMGPVLLEMEAHEEPVLLLPLLILVSLTPVR